MLIPTTAGFFRVSCNKDATLCGFTFNNGQGGKIRLEDYVPGKDRTYPRTLLVDVWDSVIIKKADGSESNDFNLLANLKVGDQVYAEIEADLRFKMNGILNSNTNEMESGYATKNLKLLYLEFKARGKEDDCSAWREAHKPKTQQSSGYSQRPQQRPPQRPPARQEAPKPQTTTQSFVEDEEIPF